MNTLLSGFKLLLAFSIFLCLSGCAVVETFPTPKEIVTKPLGTESVKKGMSQNEVRSIWGAPDQVNEVEDKERWGGKRTEWVYFGRSKLPIDAGYFHKTQRLYFDGDSLTNITEGK